MVIPYGSGEAPSKIRTVSDNLTEIEQELELLGKAITALDDRATIVLLPPKPIPEIQESDSPTLSQIATRTLSMLFALRSARLRIDDITVRINL